MDIFNLFKKKQNSNLSLSLYNNIGDIENSFLNWNNRINEPLIYSGNLHSIENNYTNKKIIGNCEYCGTGYFEDDRNCNSCGGSIKILEKIKTEIIKENYSEFNNYNPKKFMCSTATVFSYNQNDELIFTGISLLNSNMEIRNNYNKTLQHVYYHSNSDSIDIFDVEWKSREQEISKIIKLVLETQIVSADLNGTIIIRKLQYIIPKARLSNTDGDLFATPLLVRYNNNSKEEYYGYIVING